MLRLLICFSPSRLSAANGSYPFVVSLRSRITKDFSCGGALIGIRFVLTEAHRTEDGVKDVLIGMGSLPLSEQSLHPIDTIIVNPDYTTSGTIAKLALLR
ncbi:hypothetical protein RUM44_012119 [Polyplax serrata]|uniref:Peptidase S1 domain-containing protein n=1 Tax=Polyplax serrata TaxID=468196 RepID=A0ABR1BAD9_POLSC